MKLLLPYLVLFIIVHSANSFDAEDCSYDERTRHVEYICRVETGSNFNRRTNNFLYCNNYSLGIDRKSIQVLSVSNCEQDGLDSDYLDDFTDLRVFNITSVELRHIHAHDLKYSKYLEAIIVAHNHLKAIPANLFSYTAELTTLDFSYNQIRELDPFLFDMAQKLTVINFSHNSIDTLNKRLFSKLADLQSIDFSDNKIYSIENNLLIYNKKLKSLNVRNNPLLHLECELLLTLADAPLLSISLNTLDELKINCANQKTDMKFSATISSGESSQTALNIAGGQFEWIFSKTDFGKLRSLNFSNSNIQNIPALLEEASDQLTTLDLSNTFVGELNEKTLQKFTNLQYLYLSRTNLSNFQFATFYHQLNLKVLDLSFNNMNTIDFYLFIRSFQNLESLNLEGNNLTEIDTITRTHFPKLSTLAISKNRFSCEYLVKFLLQWHGLQLIENPTANQMHIGGTDCFRQNSTRNQNNSSISPPSYHPSVNHLGDLTSIKTLLIVSISILSTLLAVCIFLVIYKCVIKRRSRNALSKNIVVTYNKNYLNEMVEQNKSKTDF